MSKKEGQPENDGLIQPWHVLVGPELLHKNLAVFSNLLPTSHWFFKTISPKQTPQKCNAFFHTAHYSVA